MENDSEHVILPPIILIRVERDILITGRISKSSGFVSVPAVCEGAGVDVDLW